MAILHAENTPDDALSCTRGMFEAALKDAREEADVSYENLVETARQTMPKPGDGETLH